MSDMICIYRQATHRHISFIYVCVCDVIKHWILHKLRARPCVVFLFQAIARNTLCFSHYQRATKNPNREKENNTHLHIWLLRLIVFCYFHLIIYGGHPGYTKQYIDDSRRWNLCAPLLIRYINARFVKSNICCRFYGSFCCCRLSVVGCFFTIYWF